MSGPHHVEKTCFLVVLTMAFWLRHGEARQLGLSRAGRFILADVLRRDAVFLQPCSGALPIAAA